MHDRKKYENFLADNQQGSVLGLIFFTAAIDISDFVSIFASLNHYGGLGKTKSGSSSVGRARPCQGRGRGFESRLPLSKSKTEDVVISNVFVFYTHFFGNSPEVAGMVELVDTQDLKSCGRKAVRVRFPLLVRFFYIKPCKSSICRAFLLTQIPASVGVSAPLFSSKKPLVVPVKPLFKQKERGRCSRSF